MTDRQAVPTTFATTLAASLFLAASGSAMALSPTEVHYELKLLGKYVFFDKISNPPRMACVTCHDPSTGGTGSVSGVNLHQVAITGANPHTVGTLKPPTNSYASVITFEGAPAPLVARQRGIPPFHSNLEGCATGALLPNVGLPRPGERRWCGGNFWNGRAEGRPTGGEPLFPPAATPTADGPLFPAGATAHIGEEIFKGSTVLQPYAVYFGPTSDQALNPMPNPVEQNIERQAVCNHVAAAKYAELYARVWLEPIDCRNVPVQAGGTDKQFDVSFKRLALAMGAWQSSSDLNSFSSKRDVALATDGDGKFPLDDFTREENLGHDLFYGIASTLNPAGKNARCAFCHADRPTPAPGLPGGTGGSDTGEEPFQLYSDDGYHNIGTPKNPEIAGDGDPDRGLAGHIGDDRRRGFFKTPTLRNVDKRKGNGFTKAYTHNGWFKSLESIVHFYNTALIPANGPRPECTSDTPPADCATSERFGISRCEGDLPERLALAANCWPAPAEPGAGIPFALGNLGLTLAEEAAIVAYMKTLTDEWTPKAPPPYQPPKPVKSTK